VTPSPLLLWLFGAPALAAALAYALGKRRPKWAGVIAMAGATATLCLALAIARQVLHGLRLTALDNQFYADGLGAFVSVIVAFVGLMATVFAHPYLRRLVALGELAVERLPLYYSLDLFFISTMTAVAVTNNIIMLYVLVEATTLASALLVTYNWTRESLEAGYKYLLLCSVGITLGLLGCVIFYSAAVPLVGGARAMLITEIAQVAGQFPPMVVLVAGVLVIIGFGCKAGLVPFHAWLPDAHSQAPSPVSALLSGVTIKVAIYAIARIATLVFPSQSALGSFCVVLGAVTMLVGIITAFNQTDLKRMLAYSSVSQMGYIILGLGLGSYLGFYGAIFHLFNHALNKAMLFLCAGALLYTGGTTDMRALGAKKHSPLLAVCFFIGAFGIGGMPPLNAFWSKFAICVAAAQAHAWWALGIALLTSLLTLAVLVRAGSIIFLQQSHAEPVREEMMAAAPAVAAAAGAGGAYAPMSSVGMHVRSAEARASVAAVVAEAAMAEDSTPARAGVAGSGRSASTTPDTSLAEKAIGGDGEDERGGAPACPASMMAVIVIMAALVIVSGLNPDVLNRLLDLSARALLGPGAGR
jgi:hydrogenase-4 component F